MSIYNMLNVFLYWCFFLSILVLFLGCSYQTSRWEDNTGLRYYQTNITPPFGKQAESAGQMSATVLEDGTWELVIGRTDKGIDNTAQAEQLGKLSELATVLLRLYASGVAP